jgi:hypothetical protein
MEMQCIVTGPSVIIPPKNDTAIVQLKLAVKFSWYRKSSLRRFLIRVIDLNRLTVFKMTDREVAGASLPVMRPYF